MRMPGSQTSKENVDGSCETVAGVIGKSGTDVSWGVACGGFCDWWPRFPGREMECGAAEWVSLEGEDDFGRGVVCLSRRVACRLETGCVVGGLEIGRRLGCGLRRVFQGGGQVGSGGGGIFRRGQNDWERYRGGLDGSI